jgi:phage protein D
MTPPAVTQADSIPLYEDGQTFYVPAFELWLRNQRMDPAVVRDVIEVTYEDHIDKVDSFTLILNNWDANTRQCKYFGLREPPAAGSAAEKLAQLLQPGTAVLLKLGYLGRQPDMRTMMRGYVTTVDLELTETTAPRIVVRGLNAIDRFRVKQYTWAWPESGKNGIRDSDIAKEFAKAADDKAGRPGIGFRIEIDKAARDKEPVHENVLMHNQYPIVFLAERARRLGYSLFLAWDQQKKEEYLYFGPSENLRDKTYQLEWGRSLIAFKPTLSTGRQVNKVTVLGWDAKAKKPIKEEATVERDGLAFDKELRALAMAVNREEVVDTPPATTREEAQRRAVDLLKHQQKDLVTAVGVTLGLPDLRAGRSAEITRVDYRLDGRYFLTGTTHTFNDNGYRTQFTCRIEKSVTGGA